jgi:hypothetical protein
LIVLGNGKPEETEHMENPGVDGVILKRILVTWDARARTGFICHRIGTRGRLL